MIEELGKNKILLGKVKKIEYDESYKLAAISCLTHPIMYSLNSLIVEANTMVLY